jgi:hypothetical protein
MYTKAEDFFVPYCPAPSAVAKFCNQIQEDLPPEDANKYKGLLFDEIPTPLWYHTMEGTMLAPQLFTYSTSMTVASLMSVWPEASFGTPEALSPTVIFEDQVIGLGRLAYGDMLGKLDEQLVAEGEQDKALPDEDLRNIGVPQNNDLYTYQKIFDEADPFLANNRMGEISRMVAATSRSAKPRLKAVAPRRQAAIVPAAAVPSNAERLARMREFQRMKRGLDAPGASPDTKRTKQDEPSGHYWLPKPDVDTKALENGLKRSAFKWNNLPAIEQQTEENVTAALTTLDAVKTFSTKLVFSKATHTHGRTFLNLCKSSPSFKKVKGNFKAAIHFFTEDYVPNVPGGTKPGVATKPDPRSTKAPISAKATGKAPISAIKDGDEEDKPRGRTTTVVFKGDEQLRKFIGDACKRASVHCTAPVPDFSDLLEKITTVINENAGSQGTTPDDARIETAVATGLERHMASGTRKENEMLKAQNKSLLDLVSRLIRTEADVSNIYFQMISEFPKEILLQTIKKGILMIQDKELRTSTSTRLTEHVAEYPPPP